MAEVAYSLTRPGYDAWIADGHTGTFEDFLEDQAKVNAKERLIAVIVSELAEMSVEELQEVLEIVRGMAF